MKNYLKYLFIPLSLILWGCGTDEITEEEPQPQSPSVEMEYYVKYEATVTSIYIGDINYTVNTDKGSKTFTSGPSFSQTFGPVKKGFHATLRADAGSLYNASCDVRIYVCRGNEPFAFKANNSGGKIVYTSYIIDY